MGLTAKVKVDAGGMEAIATAARTRAMTLKAVKAGAKIHQPAVKARVPRRRGSSGSGTRRDERGRFRKQVAGTSGAGGGGLRQSIGTKAVKGRRGTTVSLAVVGPRKKFEKMVPHGNKMRRSVPYYYGHLVEGGTRPHSVAKGAFLTRVRKGSGRTSRKVTVEFGQGVRMHPGTDPQPFQRPAFDANRSKIAAAVKDTLGAELMKEVGRQAAKLKKGK